MATTQIVLASCDTKSADNYAMPVAKSIPKAKQMMTPTGTSAVSTITGASKRTDVWMITSDTTIWVKFGTSSPTASAGNDWFIMGGGAPLHVGVSVDGEVPAIITG